MNKYSVCIVFLAVAAHALPTDSKEKRDTYLTNYGTGLGLGYGGSLTNMVVQKLLVLGNIVRPIALQRVFSVVRPVVQQPVVLNCVGLSGNRINIINGVLDGRTVVPVLKRLMWKGFKKKRKSIKIKSSINSNNNKTKQFLMVTRFFL